MMKNLNTAGPDFAVIDVDTGTVLGLNLRLVEMPLNADEREDILSSDSYAQGYAEEFGVPLYFPTE